MAVFDPARLYRGSDLLSLYKDGALPVSVASAFTGFSRILCDHSFPCTFARGAFKQDRLIFLFPGKAGERAPLQNLLLGLLAYLVMLRGMSKMQAAFAVLNVLFDPEAEPLPLSSYHEQLWATLQHLHDNDSYPWPADLPTDPDDPRWSFCFAGIPIFVNMSCPAHVTRRSRNLGPSFTLVINPRDAFDDIAGTDHKGTNVRNLIRSLVAKYDGQAAAPQLGSYGDPHAREWLQYALPDDNRPRCDKCPLRIRRQESLFEVAP